MKKLPTLLTVLTLLALGAGCAGGPTPNVEKMYGDYLRQDREYSAVKIQGPVTIGETASIEVTLPHAPLSMRSADPSIAQKTIETAGSVAKAVAVGYFANEAIGALSATRDPVIVEQPAPVIVPSPAPLAPVPVL
jgi:hypothetical protein